MNLIVRREEIKVAEQALPESVQVRLMKMEYSSLSKEDIRTVYLEETGQELPFDVTLYESEQFIDEKEAAGFNGTVIHIENEQGVNEAYTIARGTEDFGDDDWHATDWSYNVMGIFVGQSNKQYDAVKNFDTYVTKEIEKSTGSKPQKFGLGHSLGGNLITLLQLTSGDFNQVNTVNAAPPSFYQLTNIDSHFKEEVATEFNVDPSNLEELYNLDQEDFQEYAEEYYETKGEDIVHLTSEQDIMTALFGLRGFFNVGEKADTVDAYPGENVKSLKKLFDEIPDEFAKDVQIYLAENYSDVYSEEGFEGLFKELTGVDTQLIDWIKNQGEDISNTELIKYGLESIDGAIEKLPEANRLLEGLSDDLPAVLDTLVEQNYLTEKESDIVHDEYMNIVSHMQHIEETIEQFPSNNPFKNISMIKDLYNDVKEVLDSVDTIDENTSDLQEQLKKGVDAHFLKMVIEGLGAEIDISYENSDMILTKNADGKEIHLNISSAMRMYNEGLSILENKEEVLSEIESKYKSEYVQDYEDREGRVMKKIRDMEESPHSYQDLMGDFPRDAKVHHQVSKIDVHEDIPEYPENLENIFEGAITYIQGVIKKEKNLLENIKESIEELFDEDERISRAIFGEREG